MTVYADVLIIINIYISYFTLRACAVILHTECGIKRISAASVLGGVCSLTALIETDFLGAMLLKAAVTAVTVLTAFGFGGIKRFALRSLTVSAEGMLICGIALMIRELTGSDFIFAANGYIYMDISALVLVTASAAVYGILSLIRRAMDKPSPEENIRLTVENMGKTAVVSAYPDSGNCLCDFLTGRPVIVCRSEAVAEIEPENVKRYISGEADDISGIRLIPMRTAGGSALTAAFRAKRITAEWGDEKKELDALIGVCPAGALENEPFDAVINPKLLI